MCVLMAIAYHPFATNASIYDTNEVAFPIMHPPSKQLNKE